ncbi:MAG: hypothetical protein FJ221_17855 [Lentisphaerae bacterium]|nr:hypothetical protein [Lentisphaerota bacterium]
MAQAPTLTAAEPSAESAWRQWHARCALTLCDADSAALLRGFAGRRASSMVRRLGRLAEDIPAPEPRDAWHLFETHLVTARTREGKRYKDWLFARVGARSGAEALDAIQGGATLILRDVVREMIRHEARPPDTSSLAAPVPGTNGLTLADLLPGGTSPSDEAEDRDLEALARRAADSRFAAADRRVRVGLCLRALDLPLDGRATERAAGCSKSTLHAAVRDFIAGLAAGVRQTYALEAPGTAHAIAIRAVRELQDLAREWGRSEKSLARFFHKVEGAQSGGPVRSPGEVAT